MSTFVYIVVLAWNHLDDTLECISSILNSDFHPINLLVVDNGSTDGTSTVIKKHFSMVEIIRSDKNLGISGGYNMGIEYALEQGADFIIIANNDISIDPKMIQSLVNDLASNPQAGIAMPKIYHYYGDRNLLWCTGARWRKFPPSVKMTGVNVQDSDKYSKAIEIEFAPSCCLLLRSSMIKKIGYFDTNFFFYNDDWDYSIRCIQAGYSIRFVPSAKMWHKVSISTQKSDKPEEWWVYFGRSTVRFYKIHKNNTQLTIYIIWFVIRELLKGNNNRILPFLKGINTERRKYI